MKIDFELTGAAEFDAMLKELGPRVARSVASKALRRAANVIRDEARTRAPVKTGELKRSIKVKSRKARKTNERTVSVGVAGKEGPLAHIVEFGAAAHPIQARPGKVLANPETREVFGVRVSHPGSPPQPFLRPAADTKAAEALDVMGRALGEGIEREAAKR